MCSPDVNMRIWKKQEVEKLEKGKKGNTLTLTFVKSSQDAHDVNNTDDTTDCF